MPLFLFLRSMCRAVFKSLFVDFEPFGGSMPGDWKEGKLGEIANITMRQSFSGSSYNTEGKCVIFFQGRAEFGFRFPIPRCYTTMPKRMAYKNDILMSVRAPVGDLNIAHADCCIGRGLAAIRSKTNQQSFILYTMKSLKEQLNTFNGEGTIFGSINSSSMHNLSICIPHRTKIDEFEKLISPMDRLIYKNNVESSRLSSIRDPLLPRLMSGEVDVSNIDARRI